MADALAPLRARLGRPIREREVLRVAATITHADPTDAIQTSRRDVLAWAQRRCGGQLPKSAWDGESFEYFAAGRTTLGTRLATNAVDLWALRGDDPDKTVPGRIWTTEIAIGRQDGELPHLSVRLLVASPEEEPDFAPAVPGLVRQIALHCGLSAGGFRLSDVPWPVSSDEDLAVLIDMLEAPSRRLPVFVASGDERAVDPARPLIDADTLARATIGLAHVVILPAHFTYGLSDAFGKVRSCYHGAVRAYLPGFDPASDPYEHPLTLGEFVLRDSAAIVDGLREFAAKESLRRVRLGQDVLAFASVRSAALQIEQEAKASSRTSEADRLADALQQIKALRADLAEKQAEAETNFDLAHQEEERAKAAEAQLHNARERIRQLEAQLVARGEGVDAGVALPSSWSEFVDWCDQTLIGRIMLAPAARRGIRKAKFENLALAARCVLWLASECRDRRLNGGGTLANVAIMPGIENAPCGEDTFKFDFQGRRLEADWHIKNGGNTRDPRRCLRIYYAWDEVTQQIVVAEMPAHRRTGAT
jgi:hypothetical protein